VSIAEGVSPQWSGDSEELFYKERGGYVMAARIDPVYAGTAVPERLFRPRIIPGPGAYSVANDFAARSDGERFLVIEEPEQPPRSHYTILVNWQESQ